MQGSHIYKNKRIVDYLIILFLTLVGIYEKIIFKIKLNKNDFLEARRFGKNKEHLEISLNGLRGIEFFANGEREKELLNQKVFFINLEWDNFKGDIVMRFVK